MTDNNHPITPPPELVQQWWDGTHGAFYEFEAVVTQAARWGANQELEACCEWVSQWRCMVGGNRPEVGLRAARRPEPPTLKDQALAELNLTADSDGAELSRTQVELIRCALESLPE